MSIATRMRAAGLKASFIATVSAATIFAAASAHANADTTGSVTAQGAVFYKMPAGELVKREASLEVPARGQGDVILRSGSLELKAHGFKTVRKHGRAVFYVVFLNPPGAPENTAVVYRGSYLRGSNAAKYWGDVFSKSYRAEDLSNPAKTTDSLINDLENGQNSDTEWRHSGGFWFGVEIGG
jgi:hypothetical protein